MVIRNTKIVYPDAVKEGFSVVCRGGRIESILPAGREKAPPDHVVDAMGAYLSPGFIDIHIHGVLGHRTDEGGDSVTAMDQLLRLAPNRWWSSPPRVPVPDSAYLRFRATTAYGDPEHPPEPDDVVTWLTWCRSWRRATRVQTATGRRG